MFFSNAYVFLVILETSYSAPPLSQARHSGFCQSPHKVIVGPSPTTSTPCRWSAEAVIPASLAPLSWPPEVFTSHSHIVSPGSPRSVFRRKGSSHLHLPTVISAPKKRKVPSPLATILSRATALPRCVPRLLPHQFLHSPI